LLITEKVLGLLLVVVFSVCVFYITGRIREGKIQPKIRPIAGIEAIPEAVQRAAELGRPVHFNPGSGEVSSEYAPQTFAGIQVLEYVAQLCAQYEVKLIATSRGGVTFPIMQDVIRQGFTAGGRPDMFQEDTVRFVSDSQFAAAAGIMGIMQRERIAANIMIGPFYAEALLLAEAATIAGALQIGSTARMYQLPFFVVVCDYTLIGDEMFAAGAFLSSDPVYTGCLVTQDYGKIISIAVMVLGALLATAKVDWLTKFLTTYGK